MNFHPFGEYEGSILENFNIGGSVFAGNNDQPAKPATLRTVVPTTGVASLGIPFLALNDTTTMQGPKAFWDLHMAWFYQQLAVIGEWQSGYQDYAKDTNPATRSMHTRVPVLSFYVEAGYLLTGETRSQGASSSRCARSAYDRGNSGPEPGNSLLAITIWTSATRSSPTA